MNFNELNDLICLLKKDEAYNHLYTSEQEYDNLLIYFFCGEINSMFSYTCEEITQIVNLSIQYERLNFLIYLFNQIQDWTYNIDEKIDFLKLTFNPIELLQFQPYEPTIRLRLELIRTHFYSSKVYVENLTYLISTNEIIIQNYKILQYLLTHIFKISSNCPSIIDTLEFMCDCTHPFFPTVNDPFRINMELQRKKLGRVYYKLNNIIYQLNNYTLFNPFTTQMIQQYQLKNFIVGWSCSVH
jgi:hypothetical protein